ncbi:DUF2637 domain-containing protein [Streptomyces oryzae]|uniref:DUF2637 domain-containing protein n=1 Tax=Streptomyces oryzae TaxID=1434886 RepID=UPI001FFE028B|nr:DUF2637 domain-containing protein [Streptomyces oryzae]
MRSTGGAERLRHTLIAVVVAGALVIAGIGFAGSYAAVRDLAERKGFGGFAPFFPIGVDAGIVVLLALDLLLTWIRIPFPLLRQTAWLLTAATIAFNGAAAWPDPLGVGMHAVIPVLFVVTVEAARHAAGRVAAITADKHMEGVRLSRWLLAFPSTFRLWRRMKLWELRNYDEVIRMEQDRLVYETRLRAQYGRSWRRKAPVEALMPLKLTRYGVPLHHTAPHTTTLPEPTPTPFVETPAVPGDEVSSHELALLETAPGPGAESAHAHAPNPEPIPELVAAPPEEPLSERGTALDESGAGMPDDADAALAQASGESSDEPDLEAVALADAQEDSAVPSRGQDDVAVGRQQEEAQGAKQAGEGGLTLVDRYYQAWAELTDKLGTEPSIQDLSDHLWVRGMAGRGGGRISPSTLRRYRMGWRIYRVWAQYLKAHGGAEPSLAELEELCAEHAIRSKGGRGDRLEQRDLAGYLTDFRRRYAALAGQ